VQDAMSAVEDLREYDVPYHVRFAIDQDVRCGHWYTATATEGHVALTPRPDLIFRAEPRVCAFDIETTKLPLHFPNSEHDQVFMISYMLDRQGYLIVNRKVVGADIDSFEYTPKPEFSGPFEVFNELDEKATLKRWFQHMSEVRRCCTQSCAEAMQQLHRSAADSEARATQPSHVLLSFGQMCGPQMCGPQMCGPQMCGPQICGPQTPQAPGCTKIRALQRF
jgi:hypothetical protein